MRPPLRRRWLSQALGITLLTTGLCALPAQAQTAPVAGTLVVSAAASLTNAFAEIGQAFEKAHPGSHITFNFAASGPLLAQIQQGAPVDVFASADQETMDRADKGGLLATGSRQNFAGNELVLIVPLGSKLPAPTQLRDLTQPGWQRIAIGNPTTVPVGRYTRQALEAVDPTLPSQLEARLITGDSVRQVLNYVARGEVDAGFVYRTDAQQDSGKVQVVMAVPTRNRVSYPIARVAGSHQGALAQDFVSYVVGPAGQQTLARYGFSAP